MPPIPMHLDELNVLDREALDRLLQDELEFQTFCNQLSTLQSNSTMPKFSLGRKHQNGGTLIIARKSKGPLQKQLKLAVNEFRELKSNKTSSVDLRIDESACGN
jgi:hypothetical protein